MKKYMTKFGVLGVYIVWLYSALSWADDNQPQNTKDDQSSVQDNQKIEENFTSARRRYEVILENKLDSDGNLINTRLEFLQERENILATELQQKETLLQNLPERVNAYYQKVKEKFKGVEGPQYENAVKDVYTQFDDLKQKTTTEIARLRADLAEVRLRISELKPQSEIVHIKQELKATEPLINPNFVRPAKEDPEVIKAMLAIATLEKVSQNVLEAKLIKLEDFSIKSICQPDNPCGMKDCYRSSVLGLVN